MSAIYLDFNATTPIDPEVAAAMSPMLHGTFGNPSSAHPYGIEAKMALEQARAQIAETVGAEPQEIVITSGGTESNNIAIAGAVYANPKRGRHIVISSVEHPAVSKVCEELERQGYEVTVVPVDENGLVLPEAVDEACREDTVLVSVMLANNEIGTIQPIKDIADVAKDYHAIMHTDAAQAVGKIPVQVDALDVDLLSIAGHKLYAPKGVGALYVRKGIRVTRVMHGADHEHGLRPGTENVLLAVGLGKACEVSRQKLNQAMAHMSTLRDKLENGLIDALGAERVRINARGVERLPNTSSVSFRGVDAGNLLTEIGHRVAASAGAACHSDIVEISPVLEAIGITEEWALGTVRFSVGRETLTQEVEEAVDVVSSAVKRMGPQALSGESSTLQEVRLTRFTKGMGCACKIRPEQLELVIGSFSPLEDRRIVVDMTASDDAAVYEVADGILLVQSVDFLTPIIDDPYEYGMVAAANSLSDIYAMGATPAFALNLVAFPSTRLPMSTLSDILQGAADKCREAGISILGGHSIEDPEPKFGLVVTGTVSRRELWTNGGAVEGDSLILTKPLGTGLIATGVKKGVVSERDARKAANLMARLNGPAADCLKRFSVHACTDITGFGFLGHCGEMMISSGLEAEITASRVPKLAAALKLAASDVVPSGTKANLSFVEPRLTIVGDVTIADQIVLADAQTSGGLLVALPAEQSNEALLRLQEAGIEDCAIVGTVRKGSAGRITVTD